MKRVLAIFIILMLLFLSLFGCSKNKNKENGDAVSADENNIETEQQEESKDTNQVKYLDYAVYLKHKDIPYLFGERFEIKSNDPILNEKRIEEIALEKLFGYDKGSFESPVPKDTKILGLEKEGSTVYLDLSKAFIDNMPKDGTLTQMALDAIVNTLTFFPENEKVVIKVEGESIKELNGVRLDKDFSFSSEFIPDK
ncbi:Sporulation and spore germination [Proteiniborus ethanoligenes]|uniref:Sporulation and spore germination n=1 Tax=Proteiniborus ethanoligenes TaxID=415015 RepID=A0A1H3RV98_9FIRM|nr:GerMN domain-containing protein [Proteiniborus ethanoligenes]SDZ29664.1 Sporulation and spore germination [Proteiniborus ethanoligenes]